MLQRHEYLNTVYRQAKCCRVGPGGCGYRSLNVTTSAAAAAAAIKGAPAPDRHFVPWKTSTGNQWQQHQHAHPNHRERISDAIEVIRVTTINQFIFIYYSSVAWSPVPIWDMVNSVGAAQWTCVFAHPNIVKWNLQVGSPCPLPANILTTECDLQVGSPCPSAANIYAEMMDMVAEQLIISPTTAVEAASLPYRRQDTLHFGPRRADVVCINITPPH